MSQCVRLCVRERLRGNKREKASASVRCFGEAPLISVKAFIVRGRSSYEERYRRLKERQEKEKLVRAGRCWWDNYTAVTVPVSHKSCAINECVCTYVWVCIFAWKDVHLCVGLCTFLIAIECCLLFLCMYTCYMCVCWYTLCRVMAALSLLKCMTMSFGVEMKFWASAVFCHFLHLYSPLFLCLCVYIYIYIFIKTTLLLLAIPSHRQRCRRAVDSSHTCAHFQPATTTAAFSEASEGLADLTHACDMKCQAAGAQARAPALTYQSDGVVGAREEGKEMALRKSWAPPWEICVVSLSEWEQAPKLADSFFIWRSPRCGGEQHREKLVKV